MWILSLQSLSILSRLYLALQSGWFSESFLASLWPLRLCLHFSGALSVLSSSVVSHSLWPHGPQPTRLLCPQGFSRQEYWSGLPCPPPGDLPYPGIEPRSPALQADSLLSEPPACLWIDYSSLTIALGMLMLLDWWISPDLKLERATEAEWCHGKNTSFGAERLGFKSWPSCIHFLTIQRR